MQYHFINKKKYLIPDAEGKHLVEEAIGPTVFDLHQLGAHYSQ